MKQIYGLVIHPNNDACPIYKGDNANCAECEYCDYIGTFQEEFYVDCNFNEGGIDNVPNNDSSQFTT